MCLGVRMSPRRASGVGRVVCVVCAEGFQGPAMSWAVTRPRTIHDAGM